MALHRMLSWLLALPILTLAANAEAHFNRCARIVGGTILTSEGEPVTLGFDEWGYNYQAKLFHGSYCDSLRGAECSEEYADVELTMKWNDAWLDNVDCDGDQLLDRPTSYRGSGAWLTNQMDGRYELEGRRCRWHQFSLFIAAPSDASAVDGIWYDDDGEELGPVIWNDFYVAERRRIDPCGGIDAASDVR
jgi:hypothetical protein